jgi:hypothetical protein
MKPSSVDQRQHRQSKEEHHTPGQVVERRDEKQYTTEKKKKSTAKRSTTNKPGQVAKGKHEAEAVLHNVHGRQDRLLCTGKRRRSRRKCEIRYKIERAGRPE